LIGSSIGESFPFFLKGDEGGFWSNFFKELIKMKMLRRSATILFWKPYRGAADLWNRYHKGGVYGMD